MAKVLVVDDDRDFVSLVSRLLELPPRVYRILRAYSAEEALGLALKRPPDLILLDLGLPGMSGVDFLDRMQKDPALAKVPVVIVTGQHEQLEKDSAELQRSTILITRKDGGLQTEQLLECICLLVGKR
jgi:twitching motility two-component system response regulator PilH